MSDSVVSESTRGGSDVLRVNRVIKRDGRVVDFDQERIINAIYKAGKAVGVDDRRLASNLSSKVVRILVQECHPGMPSVEEIQDIVERVLIEEGYAAIAKAYILYRRQHEELRKVQNLLVDCQNMIDGYVSGSDWQVNENSNMNYSLQGLNNHIISAVTSRYWLEKVYPEEIRRAHQSGDFHIHDLSLLAPYCCGWSIADLLMQGFGGVAQKVESSPARHFRTALGQVANFFYTLQGEAAGAQAFANFDTYLAPFIRHDGLEYKEVKQAIQEFVFNLNVPTRVGFQTPFVNITLDVVVPSMLANEPVIIGGKLMDSTYGEYQDCLDMFNRAFCEVMVEGDARGRIFSFPIPTYNITRDFDWDSPVTDLIMEMTAKYGIPYFANFVNSDMSPEDTRSMCCRLRLDNRELRRRGGGLFGANPLTGSIGVVTLNLPRIGYLSRDKEEFFQRVDSLMDMAKDSLMIKWELLERMTEAGLYPYSRRYLQSIKDYLGHYWHNHFSTIGVIGMNEALLNFMGSNIASAEGHAFALEVLTHMRSRLVKYQEETGRLFNLEATPGESTCYSLARKDKQAFPNIVTAGQSDPYYTNSTHLPVGHTNDLFHALDLQEDLQVCYTGGTVFHAFIGERIDDTRALTRLIQKVMSKYRIPYFTVSPTFSVCGTHGYLRGEQESCPVCNERTEVWSRVVGFYRPVQNWNRGKKSEFAERLEYRFAG